MPPTLNDRAVGRWHGILTQLGIAGSFLKGKHTACPLCGGKDRFRFDNKEGRGTWICSRCGAGDGVSLLMKKTGKDFRDVAKDIESIIGTTRVEPQKPVRSEADKRRAMKALWESCKPVAPGDPVAKYLYARTGLTEFPSCIRTAKSLAHPVARSSHPAMVTKMVGPDGKPTMLHRTYLTTGGRKADLVEVRRMMPGTIADGAAVRLADYDDALGIAEGLETALSAAALHGVPCWAALNSALLQKWKPPAGLKRLIVFGDNDPWFGGQAAAFTLAHRLASHELEIEVRIPGCVGDDWNDLHRAQRLGNGQTGTKAETGPPYEMRRPGPQPGGELPGNGGRAAASP